MGPFGFFILGLVLLVAVIVALNIKIVPQAQAYVVERLGAYQSTWSVGLHFKTPFIDKVALTVGIQARLHALFMEIIAKRNHFRKLC